MGKNNFDEMKVQQLKAYLKKNSIKGYSKLNKAELVQLAKKVSTHLKKSLSPSEKLMEIVKKYNDPTLYKIILYDARGKSYNFSHYERKIREITGYALESIKTYTLQDLLSKGTVVIIVEGRLTKKQLHKTILTSSSKKTPMKTISGHKLRNQIEDFYMSKGWMLDRYGHYKKIKDNKEYRIKFQQKSFRIEVSSRDNYGRKYWIHVGGGYYSDFKLENGKLIRIKRMRF